MRTDRLGILAAVSASVCCVGPLLLAVLGLGTLGLGAFLSKYHWAFIALSLVVLGLAYAGYFLERRRCAAAHCEIARKGLSRTTLGVATLIVLFFMGVNLYVYAQKAPTAEGAAPVPVAPAQAQATLPVSGMTCFTCELTVERALSGVKGVREAHASVSAGSATVAYNPSEVTVEALVEAINRTGYQARMPE